MTSYSQNREDIFVYNYFQGCKISILSIGENDGKTFSNALFFIENDLIIFAHLVEPGNIAQKCIDIHAGNSRVTVHQCAITETNGEYKFYESGAHVLGGTDSGLVSTCNQLETERWRKSGVQFEEMTVRGIDYATFTKHIGNPVFDFISIDCEGGDHDVLRQIDLSRTSCLCIEWNGSKLMHQLFSNHCKYYGLALAHVNNENLIFVR